MAIRTDFTAGEVLAAADLNDTFAAKLNLAGGKILQIVRATDATIRLTTSTSYADVTGMSVTITPQKSTSAILVFAVFTADAGSATASGIGDFAITDSSNNALSGASQMQIGRVNINASSGTAYINGFGTLIGYSTPATLSATTYKLRFKSQVASGEIYVRNDLSAGQMYAIEVSA